MTGLKWTTRQRFQLARLLGDHGLFGATRARTFRQKPQRSFAAPFLSPLAAVDELMGDYTSYETIADVAQYFDVSSATITTLLRNDHRLEREPMVDAA